MRYTHPVSQTSSTTRSPRPVKWLMYGLTGVVLAGWLGLLSLYFRGALLWGHLPRGGPEDPKLVGELHYSLVTYGAAAMVIATLAIFVILALLSAFEQQGARSSKKVAFIAAVLSVTATYATPVFWWFMD